MPELNEQPMPIKNDQPYVQDAVIADMERRAQHGEETYGTRLQINNGRDMLQDLYEELLDGCVYIKGLMMERDAAKAAEAE